MRVIRAQIAAWEKKKRPQTSAVRVTWRCQSKKKKILFRFWHLHSGERREEEKKGREREIVRIRKKRWENLSCFAASSV